MEKISWICFTARKLWKMVRYRNMAFARVRRWSSDLTFLFVKASTARWTFLGACATTWITTGSRVRTEADTNLSQNQLTLAITVTTVVAVAVETAATKNRHDYPGELTMEITTLVPRSINSIKRINRVAHTCDHTVYDRQTPPSTQFLHLNNRLLRLGVLTWPEKGY